MINCIFLTVMYVGLFASLLILAILAIRRIANRRCNRIMCILWGTVALRLLLPFSVTDIIRMPNVFRDEKPYYVLAEREHGTETAGNSVTEEIALRQPTEEAERPEIAKDDTQTPKSDRMKSGKDRTEYAFPENVINCLPIIWVTGAVLLLARIVAETIGLRRRTRVCVEEQGVFRCDDISIPFVFGIIRTRIFVPSSIDGACRDYAVMHEQAHLRHKDPLWRLLGAVLVAVYWFHPLVWVAFAMFCRDAEMRCDDEATAGLDREQREGYIRAILEASSGGSGARLFMTGFGSGSVKERVKNIKSKGVISMKKTVRIIAVCAVVFVLTMLVGVKYAEKKAKAEGGRNVENSERKPAAEDSRIAEAYFPEWYCGYRYPVLPEMSTWPYGNHGEMVHVCRIPEDRLKKMTTRELFETVLLYPLLADRLTGSDISGNTAQTAFNGLRDLFEREDRTECMLSWLKDNREEFLDTGGRSDIRANFTFLANCPEMGLHDEENPAAVLDAINSILVEE